jgi:hypothetical protein
MKKNSLLEDDIYEETRNATRPPMTYTAFKNLLSIIKTTPESTQKQSNINTEKYIDTDKSDGITINNKGDISFHGKKGLKLMKQLKEENLPITNIFKERENKNMGGILQDDNDRYGMKEGGPGIEALRKEAPEVVERMGYEEGGPLMDEPMMEEPMVEEPMMEEPEEEMLPDDEMEDEYLDFILDEALDNEEEDYLMSQLQDNDRLSEIFDKVIDVAQEFAGSGPVEGPGSGVSDSIPARLSDGEFVFTAKAVEEIGADNLMAMMKDAEMKADERQGLAEGGQPEEEEIVVMPVEEPASQQDIRVTKTTVGSEASQQEVNDLVDEEVKKSMLRGSRNLG